MRFPDYRSLKTFLWEEYRANPEELPIDPRGYAPGTNWARRCAPRFHRALKSVAEYAGEGSVLLDIGGYPGSFVRLARACFGDTLRVLSCGMPLTDHLVGALRNDAIEFRPCNLDPDVVSPLDLPVGLPFESESVDVITCMEVVEHLYSLRTLITESVRVLRPGGVLYITTDNVLNLDGLIRIFRSGETNLDHQLDQTTIWSDHRDQWRGHVRFYSTHQLVEAGRKGGLSVDRTRTFEHYEDPDVIDWDDHGLRGKVRRWLRGHGERSPFRIRRSLLGLRYLGLKSLSACYNNHIEVVLRKPDRVFQDVTGSSPQPVGVATSGQLA